MGENVYIFTYDISSLVASYNDYDGFKYTFVNSNMDTFPTKVECKVRLKNGKMLSPKNCKTW